jgi:hypothetical protein
MLISGFWGPAALVVLPTGGLVGSLDSVAVIGAHCDDNPSVLGRARYAEAFAGGKALMETESDYSVN